MMSSSAFFFFSKGIVFKNENSMEIFPYPFTPSPFLLLINVALASILEEKKKKKKKANIFIKKVMYPYDMPQKRWPIFDSQTSQMQLLISSYCFGVRTRFLLSFSIFF